MVQGGSLPAVLNYPLSAVRLWGNNLVFTKQENQLIVYSTAHPHKYIGVTPNFLGWIRWATLSEPRLPHNRRVPPRWTHNRHSHYHACSLQFPLMSREWTFAQHCSLGACIISWLSNHATRRLMLVIRRAEESNFNLEIMSLKCYHYTNPHYNQDA